MNPGTPPPPSFEREGVDAAMPRVPASTRGRAHGSSRTRGSSVAHCRFDAVRSRYGRASVRARPQPACSGHAHTEDFCGSFKFSPAECGWPLAGSRFVVDADVKFRSPFPSAGGSTSATRRRTRRSGTCSPFTPSFIPFSIPPCRRAPRVTHAPCPARCRDKGV